MTEKELDWLALAASQCESIIEVGSWLGRSTRALADNCNGVVMAVDTWEGSKEHQEELTGKDKNYLYDKFLENMKDTKALVYPYRGLSVEVAKNFPKQVDMVFLDASHDYDNVIADINAWLPLVKQGGILCGHDYAAPWWGVIKAVTESFKKWGYFESIWGYIKE